jgi:serine protease
MQQTTRNTRALVAATIAALGLGAALTSATALAAPQINLSAVADSDSYAQFIVKYRAESAPGSSNAALHANIDRVANAFGRNVDHVRTLATGAQLIEVKGGKLNAADSRRFMQQFAGDDSVEYVEPNLRRFALLTPNDTNWASQWPLTNPATGSIAGMNMPAAWDIGTGSGVTVAVIDTGITPHSDLSANIVSGYDFVSDAAAARDGNGRDSNPNDEGDWWTNAECGPPPTPASQNSSWHGTHVSGTIAAVTNNAKGVAGVAFAAKVQPVRVLAKCGGSIADIVDAIAWASGGTVSGVPANPTPARVINMSLGGNGTCSASEQSSITGAINRGTTVVVAAGNSNTQASGSSPANCTGVIAVAALDRNGSRAYYSNYGSIVDIAGPGGDVRAASSNGILSTLNSGTTTQGAETYSYYQGTSMATPHIAGLAALLKAKDSTLTPAQIESNIKTNARPFPSGSTCTTTTCGAGMADAQRSLAALSPPPPNVLTNGVPATGLAAATGGAVNYTMVVPAGATNLKFVISGGTGDADLYVKFGSAPTTTTYDCRPYLSGNAETCNIATAQAGTYYVMVRAYASFSGVSLTGSYTTSTPPGPFFENQTDFAINDNATVESPIAVSGVSGNAPATLKVAVTIYHTYQGDLKVDLIAPNGAIAATLWNHAGGSADNIIQTFTVNASAYVASGTWKLRVNDNATADTGRIDKWSLQF